MPVYVQGDSKLAPPIPDSDKNCLLKTKYVFIKYNLFEYYLEKFIIFNRLFMSVKSVISNSDDCPVFINITHIVSSRKS